MFEAAVRGQSPGQTYSGEYEELPPLGAPGAAGPTYAAPAQPGPTFPSIDSFNPFSSPGPMSYDPFLGAPPAAVPNSGYAPYGIHGPQPYKLGWRSLYDVGYIPEESIEGTPAELEIFEFDAEWRYTQPTEWGWLFSMAKEFRLRSYGEAGSTIPFPDEVFHLGWDFELSTPANAPWSFELGFSPSLNTDFEDNSTSDAWNWDGRGIAFYRTSPQLTWVGGVVYWDRVRDRLLPYAGVIWTPNDIYEFRLIFPEGRISKFLGTPWGVATWFYARGEFHVEAYEFEDSGFKDKYEISDWRVLLGFRSENGPGISTFIEGGWIFDRQIEFLNRTVAGTDNFDVSSGFIVRGGLRY